MRGNRVTIQYVLPSSAAARDSPGQPVKGLIDRVLYGLTVGYLAFKLGTLLINALTFPRLRGAQDDSASGALRVSLLVPARDEADNLRHVLPPLLLQGALEVIVLDDGSSDGTSDLARQLGARVITGQPLPPGWTGKSWACQQLAEAAQGEVLVFTDADVTWHPGALRAVLAELDRSGAGLLSVFPQQHNRTLGERLLTPQVDAVLLSLFAAPLLNVPHRSAAVANGQVMAFRRGTYERLGGHSCVKAKLLEDVAFAREVKGAHERLGLALGQALISVRMYRSYPQSVRGFAKGVLDMHGGRRDLLLANLLLQLAVYTLPLLRGQFFLVALAFAEGLGVRLISGRIRPAELAETMLTPLWPICYVPVVQRAASSHAEWKGRRYAVDEG